jgi:hypothetical protein
VLVARADTFSVLKSKRDSDFSPVEAGSCWGSDSEAIVVTVVVVDELEGSDMALSKLENFEVDEGGDALIDPKNLAPVSGLDLGKRSGCGLAPGT